LNVDGDQTRRLESGSFKACHDLTKDHKFISVEGVLEIDGIHRLPETSSLGKFCQHVTAFLPLTATPFHHVFPEKRSTTPPPICLARIASGSPPFLSPQPCIQLVCRAISRYVQRQKFFANARRKFLNMPHQLVG
jgi:hypothetical protein